MAANLKKKRLSMAVPLRVLQDSDVEPEGLGSPLIKANDDFKEKRERRKSAAVEFVKKDLMLTPHATPKKASRINDFDEDEENKQPAAMLPNAQLSDLYANCIKMCTENKINQKNSWSLNLIDYISEVLDVRHGEMTNFQVASCTLDASVKIYSCRVDSVLSDTFKVLGGLNRGDAPAAEEGAEENAGENGEGEAETKKAKPRAKTSYVTLEANPAALNVKKFDLEFDIDPLFRKTSAAFDEGGAKGLLLNHLTVQDTCQLLFDSADTVDATSSAQASSCPMGEFWATFASELRDISSREVCPTFSGFSFANYTEVAPAGSNKAAPEPLPPAIDFDLADDDAPCGGFDDDYGEIFAPEPSNEVTEFTAVTSTSAALAAHQNNEIVMALASTVDDYTYFNSRKMANWAGPSHWKIRPTTTEAGETKKKAPKTKFFIDFHAEPIDRASAFANSRAATTLAKATLTKASTNTLLPRDEHVAITDLTRLFCRPAWTAKVMGRKRGVNEAVDADAAPYNYANDNDMNNYCAPADDNDGDFGDDGGDMPSGDNAWDRTRFDMTDIDQTMIAPTESSELTGDKLLQAPRQVDKIDIHYERVAKRINIKQLKTTIWDEISHETPATTPEKEEEAEEGKSFADVYSILPNKVGGSTASGLSVSIAFVCLLHLANEKNLVLSDLDDMSDLRVKSH